MPSRSPNDQRVDLATIPYLAGDDVGHVDVIVWWGTMLSAQHRNGATPELKDELVVDDLWRRTASLAPIGDVPFEPGTLVDRDPETD